MSEELSQKVASQGKNLLEDHLTVLSQAFTLIMIDKLMKGILDLSPFQVK
jgi:glycine cleavage system regulatory protein